MSFSSFVKEKLGGVATWAGSAIGGAIGGSTGAKIGGSLGTALGDSLMNKGGVGGDYQIQSTAVQAPSYGGRMGRERSDEAGSTGVAKTVDGKDLNYEWERRLMTAMSKQREYKRDLT
ncbi:hypothetical protein N9Y58_01335 [Alphaproteobacteria bacterium]|nr:hypothetical protein [Alphaproteobacteria bacterium]